MNKTLYKTLSWTWGLPMTLIGALASIALRLFGYKPNHWGGSTFFAVGKGWGGISFGPYSIVSDDYNEYILTHEFGHSIQNCFFGPFFLFVVGLPSLIRYWYREIIVRYGIKSNADLPDYYSIWFESQASKLGAKYLDVLK